MDNKTTTYANDFNVGSRVRYIKEGKPFTNLNGTIIDLGISNWIVKFDEPFKWHTIENETIMACMEDNLIII